MYKYVSRTKEIICSCGNVMVISANTKPEDRTAYGFSTHIQAAGILTMDHFGYVLCICGKAHSIKRFTNAFHSYARKQNHGEEKIK